MNYKFKTVLLALLVLGANQVHASWTQNIWNKLVTATSSLTNKQAVGLTAAIAAVGIAAIYYYQYLKVCAEAECRKPLIELTIDRDLASRAVGQCFERSGLEVFYHEYDINTGYVYSLYGNGNFLVRAPRVRVFGSQQGRGVILCAGHKGHIYQIYVYVNGELTIKSVAKDSEKYPLLDEVTKVFLDQYGTVRLEGPAKPGVGLDNTESGRNGLALAQAVENGFW